MTTAKAEIDELRSLRVGKKDVARFDVPVNEVVFESSLETFGDLDSDAQHLGFEKAAVERSSDHRASLSRRVP